MKNIYWCYLLYFIFQFSFGQETFFNGKFDLYKIEGLKQHSIKSIVTDINGMIWVSTELGLHRYDGQILKKVIGNKYARCRTNPFVWYVISKPEFSIKCKKNK